ncbi:hypothetical protein C0995_003282 [Termitomyces sp. Mi166|nr:hypothetical protein C0995_003282 [Termitomyces sp. Mi166\
MSIVSISHRWTILSRALSHSPLRQTTATVALRLASRPTSNSVDFVGNTTKLNSPSDRFIFEDESEDYANVTRNATPKTLSTLGHIEATLPLRLPEPVVSDTSIFEDFSSDTSSNDYATLRVSLREPPSSAFQTLETLIRREQNEEAWALCQEMLSSGIDIPKSNVYGRAAMAVLASHELSEQDQISRCSLWLSMIPSAHENNELGNKRIILMRRRVFQGLQPTITLAIQFSLIMASKGYLEFIAPEAVVFVTRFAPPPISLRFIKDFLTSDFAYIGDVDSKQEKDLQGVRDEERLHRLQELAHLVQGPAIETLTRSGEFAAAMLLLPTPKKPFRLSTRTYDLLLSRLRDTRVGSFPDYIDLVEKLRHDPSYYEEPWSLSYAEIDPWHTRTKHFEALKHELDPASPLYIGESLAVQLRSILDGIRQSELSVPELVAFFSDYYDSGRTTAIIRLRKLALGRNWPTGSAFLYAEMSYYLNHALYLLVLKTYANHFYFSGVPEEELTAAIRYLEANDDSEHRHPAYSTKQKNLIRRFFPNESHTDLAWHALVRAAPSTRDVDALYHRFMQYQLRIRNENPPENATRLSFPPSIEHSIGTSVFTVFLSRLLRPNQPSRASEFFRDMAKVGVNPTIHHFTLLATFYVHVGDIQRTFSVVRALEQEHPVTSPSPIQISLETIHRQRPEPGIPIPDAIFYTSLLGALVELKYLKEAQEIRRLFYKRFIHTMYLHPPLDIALRNLKRLEYEVDQQRVTFQAERPQS